MGCTLVQLANIQVMLCLQFSDLVEFKYQGMCDKIIIIRVIRYRSVLIYFFKTTIV